MYLINFVLFLVNFHLLYNKKTYYTLVVYVLVVTFHFFPLVAIDFLASNFDEYNLINSNRLNLSILIWSISFLIIILTISSKQQLKASKIPINVIFNLGLVVLIFSLIILYNNIFSFFLLRNFGYLAVYNASKDFFIKNTTILPFYIFSANVLIANFFKNDFSTKPSIFFKGVIFLYFLSMFSYLLFGGRSGFLYFAIVTLIILFSDKRIHFSKLLISSLSLIFFLVFVGIQRDGSSDVDLNQSYLQRIIFELSQTVTVFNNSIDLIDIDLSRYLSLILSIIPNSISKIANLDIPLNLSQLYVNKLDPLLSDLGGGFGFSILAEFYIIGGYLGVIIGSILFSVLSFKIDNTFAGKSAWKIGFYSVIAYYLLMAPRGELGDLYRPFIISTTLYLLSRINFSFK
jgi:oligosaccharide repeat unit polymerase